MEFIFSIKSLERRMAKPEANVTAQMTSNEMNRNTWSNFVLFGNLLTQSCNLRLRNIVTFADEIR